MIIQGILDFIAQALAGLIRVIPPLPPEADEALGQFSDAASTLGSAIARFGIIVPLDTIGTIVTLWLGLLLFWGAVLGFRAILWVVNR